MSINFNRNHAQSIYEQIIDVTDPSELTNKKEIFKTHTLSINDVTSLREALNVDAVDFFYNGVLSFSEGIDSIFHKRFSWATVKLYYSVYYLIRASLAARGIAMIRCNSMFRLSVRPGQQPFGTNAKKYNTTHEGTISHYRDLFSLSDQLLSNNIGTIDAYQWIMEAREIVNYRNSSFEEPDCLEIWDLFSECVDNGSFVQLLKQLEEDAYIMCFQEEYAIVAIPIKRMQQTINDLADSGLLSKLPKDKETFARIVIGYDNRELSILRQIFC